MKDGCRPDIEVPPDPLTNASYVRKGESGWLLLLVFPRLCSLGGVRITIPHESEVVLLVLSLLCNAPGTVIKTPYSNTVPLVR